MKITTKKLPHSEIEMTIELDLTEWEKFINEASKELSQNIQIEGFRPGKAPQNLVEQRIGSGRILERAADLAIKDKYVEAAEKEQLQVVAPPKIEVLKIAKDNPFEFRATVQVVPELQLADYQKISQEEKKPKAEDSEVKDKEVDDAIEWIQKSRTKYATVNRAAQKDDRVEVDFAAKHKGEVISEGESKNHPVLIGEGRFVPGFEENLIGMKENEEKKFSLVFPKDFHNKDLSGQDVDFEVKMKVVQESQKPELDDDFAKSLGAFENLDALKKSIKDGIHQEKEQKQKEVWRAKVLEKISEKSQADIPSLLIDSELKKMDQEMEMSANQMGLDAETYLKNIKKTRDELKEEWLPKAKSRVMAALVLREIAKKEKIEVPESEIEEAANKFLLRYPDIKAAQSQIDIERLKEYTKGSLVNEKVFQKLEELSQNS